MGTRAKIGEIALTIEADFFTLTAVFGNQSVSYTHLKRVLCVDCGMDEETRHICETICREYRFMEIVTPEELGNSFRLQEQ